MSLADRRWVIPVVIGADVLALGGGIGLGVALGGGGGETEEVLPTVPADSTFDSTNSGGGGSSESSGGGGASTNPGGGTGTTSQPTSPPAPGVPKPVFTTLDVSPDLVECDKDGDEKYLNLVWKTTGATTVDLGALKGSTPDGSGTSYYRCSKDYPTEIIFVAHGPGGDTTKTLSFCVNFRYDGSGTCAAP